MKKILWTFIFVFIAAFLLSLLLNKIEVKYRDEIDNTASEYNLDKNLVYALIMAESGFKPEAESVKEAAGLMQITPDTALWCAEKVGDVNLAAEVKVPEVNIRLGCFYLSYLMDKYEGEETAALAAYNAGSGHVDEWLANPDYSADGKSLMGAPYPETDNYIKKIAFYKKLYKFLYGD